MQVTVPICPCCGYDLTPDTGATIGPFSYDPEQGVMYDGQRVRMRRQCHEVLGALMRTPDRVIRTEALRDRLGSPESDSNIVTVIVSHARKAFHALGVALPVESVWGVGYRWDLTA